MWRLCPLPLGIRHLLFSHWAIPGCLRREAGILPNTLVKYDSRYSRAVASESSAATFRLQNPINKRVYFFGKITRLGVMQVVH